MPHFYHIKNEVLKKLVAASESILSQREKDAQDMIDMIANLPPEGQKQMIARLQEEQNQIQKRKLLQGKTLQQDTAEAKKAAQALKTMEHEYDIAALKVQREDEQKENEERAESILESL